MHSEQSAPLLEELLRALGTKIGTTLTAESVAEELQRYLDYGVPPAQARAAILRQHGAAPARTEAPTARKTLAELAPSESYVNLLVRIVAISEKDITVKGEPRRIQYGILGDESMTRPFTAWKPIAAKKGDVLKIAGAYTKEYQGAAEVHFGDRVVIEAAAADSLPKTPVERAVQVADLAAGLSNLTLSVRILNVGPRPVTVQGVAKTVWSGVLADATGRAGFTSWHDFGLKDGQVVRIKGGYVRTFRGAPQFTFDEKATIETLPEDAVAAPPSADAASPVCVADLYVGSGATDVTVEATLLEVRPGSGLILRCEQCNRALADGACRLHGKTDGRPDLRIKGILDDGTAAVNAVFGRETTEALLGRSLAEAQALAKTGSTAAVVEVELKTKLLARPLRVRGNVVVDEFGPTFLVQEATLVQRDLAAAAEALLAELEGAA